MDAFQRRRKIWQLKHRWQRQQQQNKVGCHYYSNNDSSQHQLPYSGYVNTGHNTPSQRPMVYYYYPPHDPWCPQVERTGDVVTTPSTNNIDYVLPNPRQKHRREVFLLLEQQKQEDRSQLKKQKQSNKTCTTSSHLNDAPMLLQHEEHSILKNDTNFMEGNDETLIHSEKSEDYETPPRIRRPQQQEIAASSSSNLHNDDTSKVFRAKISLTPPRPSNASTNHQTAALTNKVETSTTSTATYDIMKRNADDKNFYSCDKQRSTVSPSTVDGKEVISPPKYQRSTIRSTHSDSDVAFGVTAISTGGTNSSTSKTYEEDDFYSMAELEELNHNSITVPSFNLPPVTSNIKRMQHSPPHSQAAVPTITQQHDSANSSIVKSSSSMVLLDDQSSYVSSCSSENKYCNREEEGSICSYSSNKTLNEEEEEHGQKKTIFVGAKNCIFDVTKSYSSSTEENHEEEELSIQQLLTTAENINKKSKYGTLTIDNDEDFSIPNEDMFYASSETDLHLIHLAITRSTDTASHSGGGVAAAGACTGCGDLSPPWYSRTLRAARQSNRAASESFVLLARPGSNYNANNPATVSQSRVTQPVTAFGPIHCSNASTVNVANHRRCNSDLGYYSSSYTYIPNIASREDLAVQQNNSADFLHTHSAIFLMNDFENDRPPLQLFPEQPCATTVSVVTDTVLAPANLLTESGKDIMYHDTKNLTDGEEDTQSHTATLRQGETIISKYNIETLTNSVSNCTRVDSIISYTTTCKCHPPPMNQINVFDTSKPENVALDSDLAPNILTLNSCVVEYHCQFQSDNSEKLPPLTLTTVSSEPSSLVPSPLSLLSMTPSFPSSSEKRVFIGLCISFFTLGCITSLIILSRMASLGTEASLIVQLASSFKESLGFGPSLIIFSTLQNIKLTGETTYCLMYDLLLPVIVFATSRNFMLGLLCVYVAQLLQIVLKYISITKIEVDANSIVWVSVGILWATIQLCIGVKTPIAQKVLLCAGVMLYLIVRSEKVILL